jgi:hypothetical protein
MVAVRAAGNKRLCCVCGARCPYVVVTKADAWDASLLSRMPITMREGEHSTYWYNRRTGAYFHDSDQYYAVSRAAGKIPLPFYQPTVRFRLQFFFISPTSRSEIKLKLHLTMFFFFTFQIIFLVLCAITLLSGHTLGHAFAREAKHTWSKVMAYAVCISICLFVASLLWFGARYCYHDDEPRNASADETSGAQITPDCMPSHKDLERVLCTE